MFFILLYLLYYIIIIFTNCQLLSIIKRIIDEFGYSWHHWAYKRYGCITGDNAGFFHIDGEIQTNPF